MYEHKYALFKGDSEGAATDEYLNWRCFLQKYIVFGALVTATQKFSGMKQLSSGKIRQNIPKAYSSS